MLHLMLFSLLAAPPADFSDFKAKVAGEVAAAPNLPDFRALRPTFLHLKASDYMLSKLFPGPQTHELNGWLKGHDKAIGGLMIAQEVATGWERLSPSPASDFPPGTPPETIAKMQDAERAAFIDVGLETLALWQHPLAPVAIWHLTWAKATPPKQREKGIAALGATWQPASLELLVACIDRPPELVEATALATHALIERVLDPKLGADEEVVIAALGSVSRSYLERLLGSERDKPIPAVVKKRIETVISKGADEHSGPRIRPKI